nr:ribonuclease H-like domain-containing protein [Tanacetum cinerariifolium]
MLKSFPLLVKKFPLPENSPTASEESFPLLSKRDATAEEVCTAKKLKVIKFVDSYEAPQKESGTGSASESSAKKKGRTVAVTTKDMQKRKNDVKARTTLLLALADEHQLRFSKYKTAQELWAAILKAFEGSETLEQTFNKLQAIVSHLEFMDVEIEQDDLNQKFLTSLDPEGLMYTIVCRNRSDLDTMSLDDLYNHLKVYEPEVQKKSESNSQNMAFISSAKNNSGKREVNTASILTASTHVSPTSAEVATASISYDTVCAYIASQSNGSQIKYEDINQIDEDDIKEMDINQRWSALIATRWVTLLGSAGHPRAKTGDGIRATWPMKKENHALVADEEAPTEFALMAKSSSSSKNKEIKLCEKIRGLEFDLKNKNIKIENLLNELEQVKKEKEGLDSKLTGFESASKDLDTLLGSQRSDTNKEGLGYSAVPPPAQVYSPPKKDMSWT